MDPLARSLRAALYFITCGILLAAGCWDQVQIDERSFALEMAIDLGPRHELAEAAPVTGARGEEEIPDIEGRVNPQTPASERPELLPDILLTLKIPRPEGLQTTAAGGAAGQSSGSQAFLFVEATGKTLEEAINRAKVRLARDIFFGHIGVVVIGEQLARSHQFESVFRQLMRNPELAKTAFMVVAFESIGASIIRLEPPQVQLPKTYLTSALSNAPGLNRHQITRIWEFYRALENPGADPAVPGVRPVENALEISRTAAFEDAVMKGWLGAAEGRGVRWLSGTINDADLTIPSPRGNAMSPVIADLLVRRKVVPIIDGNRTELQVEIDVEGDIASPGAWTTLEPPEYALIQSEAARTIRAEARAAFVRMQQLGADLPGFGKDVRRAYPRLWRQLDWESRFRRAELTLDVSVRLRRQGLTQ